MKTHTIFIIQIIIVICLVLVGIIQIKIRDIERSELNNYNYLTSEYKEFLIENETTWVNGPLDFSMDGNLIIYRSNNDHESDFGSIWIINSIGTNRHRLFYENVSTFDKGGIKFNLDGNKIIFTSSNNRSTPPYKSSSIDILIKNGSRWDNNSIHKKLLESNNSRFVFVSFTPDGKKIVYQSIINETNNIWIMNSDGNNKIKLTSDETIDSEPSISPDGLTIIYLTHRPNEGFNQIWLMDINGNNKRFLLSGNYVFESPRFTNHGKIMYISSKASPKFTNTKYGNVWIMDENSDNQMLIISTYESALSFDTNPSMTPNGSKIFFTYERKIYYVEDQDKDGKWEDTDHDGIANIIDGYKNETNKGNIIGYLNNKDNLKYLQLGNIFIMILFIAIFIIWLAKNIKKAQTGKIK